MASVHQRGKKWVVMYWYETETGQKKQKCVSSFNTKQEAWAAAQKLEDMSNAGIEVNGGSICCGELMEQWFASCRRNWEVTTRGKYSRAMNRLEETFIAETQVRKLNTKTFDALIAILQARPVSLDTAVRSTEPLRLSLSWGIKQGLFPVNPLANVTMPKAPKRKQRILSDQDVDDLVAASASGNRRRRDFRIPLLLALYGGLRKEECAGLQWESVDFKAGTITITVCIVSTEDGAEHIKAPKTDCSARTISMPRWVMDELHVRYNQFLSRSNEHTKKNNPDHRVCVMSTGRPYSLKSYAHASLRLIREVNAQREKQNKPRMPEASFHDLRHTHAAMLIRMGIQPKVISERLGHASISITMDTYGYLMPGLQQGVADAFDREYEEKKRKADGGEKNLEKGLDN